MNGDAWVYLVTYDISDKKRLREVYNTMRGFGEHLQYSVFRCVLTDRRHAMLHDKLGRILNHAEDQVLVWKLGHQDAARSWRFDALGRPYTPSDRVVIVV